MQTGQQSCQGERSPSEQAPFNPPADRVINCAQALHPVQTEWLPLVTCLEATPLRRMLAAVNTCAKRAGLDAAELVECADGPQGDALEAAAAAATAALRPPHTYVPWVVVEGVPLGELDDKLKVSSASKQGERRRVAHNTHPRPTPPGAPRPLPTPGHPVHCLPW